MESEGADDERPFNHARGMTVAECVRTPLPVAEAVGPSAQALQDAPGSRHNSSLPPPRRNGVGEAGETGKVGRQTMSTRGRRRQRRGARDAVEFTLESRKQRMDQQERGGVQDEERERTSGRPASISPFARRATRTVSRFREQGRQETGAVHLKDTTTSTAQPKMETMTGCAQLREGQVGGLR